VRSESFHHERLRALSAHSRVVGWHDPSSALLISGGCFPLEYEGTPNPTASEEAARVRREKWEQNDLPDVPIEERGFGTSEDPC